MPISAEKMKLYPGGSIKSPEWRGIVAAVGERSGWRCEGGSPRYPDCQAVHGEPHPVTGSKVVLTVAHLFDDGHDTRDLTRLRHWCQRCHLTYDAKKHAENAAATRRRKSPQGDMLDAVEILSERKTKIGHVEVNIRFGRIKPTPSPRSEP